MLIRKIWEFPQNFLGFILFERFRRMKKIVDISDSKLIKGTKIIIVSKEVKISGISLGSKIIISEKYLNREKISKHEEGHCIQSMILGPMYLIFIGIPSFLMNLMSTYSSRKGKGIFYERYYERWPENWADQLGKVNRKK